MEDHFGILVRFTLKDGAEEAFDKLVAETVEEIRAHEPDTLIYTCHTVEEHPQQRIFYELYRNRTTFNAHEAQPHIARFLADREQYLLSYEVDFLALTTGKGVPMTGEGS